MNNDTVQGKWQQLRGNIKTTFGKLTDDDLQYLEGKQDELLGRIQKRTGESREAVENAIENYRASLRRASGR
jgi:uncharacterized protein YjbJ (UPF0337 family)